MYTGLCMDLLEYVYIYTFTVHIFDLLYAFLKIRITDTQGMVYSPNSTS